MASERGIQVLCGSWGPRMGNYGGEREWYYILEEKAIIQRKEISNENWYEKTGCKRINNKEEKTNKCKEDKKR